MPVVGVEKMMDTNQDIKTEIPTVKSKSRSVIDIARSKPEGWEGIGLV